MIMKKVLFIMAVSAMAAGCADNSIPKAQLPELDLSNPLLAAWDTPHEPPPFSEIKLADYEPAFDAAIACSRAEIDAIVDTSDEPTFENTIAAYDASGRMLQRTSLIFEMLAASDATPEMQAVEQEAMPLLAAHADEIRMNERLFGRIKAVYDRREALPLTAEQRRLTEKLYRRFVRSGALLDEAAMGAGMNAPYVVDGTLTADQELLPGEEAGRPEQIRLAFSRVVDNVVVAVYVHLYTQYADPEELLSLWAEG